MDPAHFPFLRRTELLRWAAGAAACVLCGAWGFPAHKAIHAAAIHTLPPPLHAFFKRHAEFVIEHAVDADRRKFTVADEGPRHYIDLDRLPADLPRTWSAACDRLCEDSLKAHGIAPFHAPRVYARLVDAFDRGDEVAILRCAVDLGHYLSDMHVPLHTSSNHNGQFTGQRGVHGLWEGRLPERFLPAYRLTPGAEGVRRARYVRDFPGMCWAAVDASHAAVDSVLQFERTVRERLGESASFAWVERGRVRERLHSDRFVEAYHTALDGQVERRMQAAVVAIGDAWTSAWIEAGSPPLPAPPPPSRLQRFLTWLTGR
jgi:hypothetical protein